MPQKYSVLDNGQGPSKEQRRFVRQYLKKKGVKRAAPGMERSKREKRLRGEARALYRASKAPKKPTPRQSDTPAHLLVAQNRASKAPKKPTPRQSDTPVDRRFENRAKVDKAERTRQERMRPKVDREAMRQRARTQQVRRGTYR